ncbi:MAG: lysophospholipid acyltransferase family protein [Nakamurella sp.]
MASTDVPAGRRRSTTPSAGDPGTPTEQNPPETVPAVPPAPQSVAPVETGWKRSLAGSLAFVRRRMTGEYEVDDFGYDPDFTDHVVEPPLRLLYEKWFRIEALGLENIADTGGALLVANHSGTIAIDALMAAVAVREHHPQHRALRMLGADLIFQTPFLGPIIRKTGSTLACNPDAERLLSSGELVSVFPEGFKGVGKPYSQRYKLQRFGRGGFVTAALRTGAPIIPVSIVGAEEIYPLIGNIKPLARALGFPYFPVTPTFPLLGPLGAVPLPSKWIIEFGEPIPTDIYPEHAADDPMVVFNLTDQVRETIQQTLYRLLLRRGHPFLG